MSGRSVFEPIRVLYVDDGRSPARRADALAAGHGFDVVVAGDATAGRHCLADADLDCVVVDLEPSAPDGLEFVEAVRAERPSLPVVLVIDRPDDDHVRTALDAGATDCLPRADRSESCALLAHRIERAVPGSPPGHDGGPGPAATADEGSRGADDAPAESGGERDPAPPAEAAGRSSRGEDDELMELVRTALAAEGADAPRRGPAGGDAGETDPRAGDAGEMDPGAGDAGETDPGAGGDGDHGRRGGGRDRSDAGSAERRPTDADGTGSESGSGSGFVFDVPLRSSSDERVPEGGTDPAGGERTAVDPADATTGPAAGREDAAGPEGSATRAGDAAGAPDRPRASAESGGPAGAVGADADAGPSVRSAPASGSADADATDAAGARTAGASDPAAGASGPGDPAAASGAGPAAAGDEGPSTGVDDGSGRTPSAGSADEEAADTGAGEPSSGATEPSESAGGLAPEEVPRDEATGVLVQCGSDDDRRDAACSDLLGLDAPGKRSVLLVRYGRLDASRLERIAAAAERVRIIAVGYDQPVPDAVRDAVETVAVANPSEVTRLGIVTTSTLRDWESEPGRTVVCFDSLTVLLRYKEVDDVFRFVHLLLNQLHASDAISHFHVDPDAADPRELGTLRPLFDGTATVDAG